jgi:hypothetical protein
VSDSSGWSAPDDPSGRPQDPQPGYHPQQPPPQYYAPPYQLPPPAPKPGVIPLRPLGLGEILDGAITAMRTYPKQMLGLTALVSALSNLLVVGIVLLIRNTTDLFVIRAFYDTPGEAALAALRVLLFTLLPTLLIALLARMFLAGVLTIVMGKAVLGQPVTIREAWQHVRPRIWSLIGVSVLFTLIVIGGTILLVIPGIWLYTLFSLASTALILEGAKVGRAFGRSNELLRDAWWRTFGILLLAALIAGILQYIVAIPFNLLDGGLNRITGSGPVPGFALAILITVIGGIIADVITLPFSAGVTTLVYIDRRMRREGMDIELTRQAGLAAPPGPTPPATW